MTDCNYLCSNTSIIRVRWFVQLAWLQRRVAQREERSYRRKKVLWKARQAAIAYDYHTISTLQDRDKISVDGEKKWLFVQK